MLDIMATAALHNSLKATPKTLLYAQDIDTANWGSHWCGQQGNGLGNGNHGTSLTVQVGPAFIRQKY